MPIGSDRGQTHRDPDLPPIMRTDHRAVTLVVTPCLTGVRAGRVRPLLGLLPATDGIQATRATTAATTNPAEAPHAKAAADGLAPFQRARMPHPTNDQKRNTAAANILSCNCISASLPDKPRPCSRRSVARRTWGNDPRRPSSHHRREPLPDRRVAPEPALAEDIRSPVPWRPLSGPCVSSEIISHDREGRDRVHS